MWLYRVEAMLVSTLGLKAEVEARNLQLRKTLAQYPLLAIPIERLKKNYHRFYDTAFSKLYPAERSIG